MSGNSSRGRSALYYIWKNFIASVTPTTRSGKFIGTDNAGTKYFEIPPDPQRGKRRPVRWMETTAKDDYLHKPPAEWEAWLRLRRDNPPTPEEIAHNVSIADANQRSLEAQRKEPEITKVTIEQVIMEQKKEVKEKAEFPKFKEYESFPGVRKEEK